MSNAMNESSPVLTLPLISVHQLLQHYHAHNVTSGGGVTELRRNTEGSDSRERVADVHRSGTIGHEGGTPEGRIAPSLRRGAVISSLMQRGREQLQKRRQRKLLKKRATHTQHDTAKSEVKDSTATRTTSDSNPTAARASTPSPPTTTSSSPFQFLTQSINPSKLIPTTYSHQPYVALCIGSHTPSQLKQLAIQFAAQINVDLIAILDMKKVRKLWGESDGALDPIIKKFNGNRGILILDDIHLAKSNVIFMLLKLWKRGVVRRHINSKVFRARRRKFNFGEKKDKEFEVVIDVRNIIFILNSNVLSSAQLIELLDPSMEIFSNHSSDERVVEKILGYYGLRGGTTSTRNLDAIIHDIRTKVTASLVEKFNMQHVGVTSFDRVNIILPFLPASPSLVDQNLLDYIIRKLQYYNHLFLFYCSTRISWRRTVEQWILQSAVKEVEKSGDVSSAVPDGHPSENARFAYHQFDMNPQLRNSLQIQLLKKTIHQIIRSQVLRDELNLDRLHDVISKSPPGKWSDLLTSYIGSFQGTTPPPNAADDNGSQTVLGSLLRGTNKRTHVHLYIEQRYGRDVLQRDVSTEILVPNTVGSTVYSALGKFVAGAEKRKERRKRFFQRLRGRL